MVPGYEKLLPEELGVFFDVLLVALSRTLRDLAIDPPETHHREWILFHLMAFIEDEAIHRRLGPSSSENLRRVPPGSNAACGTSRTTYIGQASPPFQPTRQAVPGAHSPSMLTSTSRY